MKKLLLNLLAFIAPFIALGQWNSDFNPANDYTITGNWDFQGEVTMTVVTVDSLTIEYIDATLITADSLRLGTGKELMLDNDNDTYIYSCGDDTVSFIIHNAGANRGTYKMTTGGFYTSGNYSSFLANSNRSRTTPTLCPDMGKPGTGIGGTMAVSELSFICNSAEIERVTTANVYFLVPTQLSLRTKMAGDSTFLNMMVDAADTTLKVWNGTAWVVVQDLTP